MRKVSLDEKLRYLKEIESIHRLSKKVLPPEGTTWARIADQHLKKALGMPVGIEQETLDVRASGQMHQHSPRTARVIERTLRNGIVHPDVLHSYRNDKITPGRSYPFYDTPAPRVADPSVVHYVQHGSSDLEYPHGHLQGYGFVPSTHDVESHVLLEDSVRPVTDAVPTTMGTPRAQTRAPIIMGDPRAVPSSLPAVLTV